MIVTIMLHQLRRVWQLALRQAAQLAHVGMSLGCTAQAAQGHLIASKGCIINCASPAGMGATGGPESRSYRVARAAQVQLLPTAAFQFFRSLVCMTSLYVSINRCTFGTSGMNVGRCQSVDCHH